MKTMFPSILFCFTFIFIFSNNSVYSQPLDSGGLTELVTDLSPVLGADLDVNDFEFNNTGTTGDFVFNFSAANDVFNINDIFILSQDGVDNNLTINNEVGQSSSSLFLSATGGDSLTFRKDDSGAAVIRSQGDGDLSFNNIDGDGNSIFLSGGNSGTLYWYQGLNLRFKIGSNYIGVPQGGALIYALDDSDTGIKFNQFDRISLRAGNVDLVIALEGTNDYVTINGCTFYGIMSAPVGTIECDSYWDAELNMLCYYNGTNWLQADDWSTVCT